MTLKYTERFSLTNTVSNCKQTLHDSYSSLKSGIWSLIQINGVLHLGHSNRESVYKMGSVELQTTPVENDLVVFVDDILKFCNHVCYAVNKASRLLGLIRLTFSCIDEKTLLRLFTTIIRLHFEYGNIKWHPRHRIDKLEIDKIHRRATKLVPRLKHLPYEKYYKPLN